MFDHIDRDRLLKSLRPEEVLGKLDLSAAELADARRAAGAGDQTAVFAALIEHYRRVFPFEPANRAKSAAAITTAEKVIRQKGWFAWDYGYRTERKGMRLALKAAAPTAFATVIVPYQGTGAPEVAVSIAEGFAPGDDRVALTASAFGETFEIGRELSSRKA